MCACMYGKQPSISSVFLRLSSSFSRKDPLANMELTGKLVSSLQGSLFLPPKPGITRICSNTQPFTLVPGL